MSGSGNNKITSVLGASTITAVGGVALEANDAETKWVVISLSISVSLAVLAILLKVSAVVLQKRAR